MARARDKVLRPVHPNAGLQAMYRRKIDRLVDDMARSYAHWVEACYRQNTPAITMAMDSERRLWVTETEYSTIVEPADFYDRPFDSAAGFAEVERTESRTVFMAMDATPAKELQREIAQLGARWRKRFEIAAPRLARWFAAAVERRSMRTLRSILKDGGISVEFVMTKGMRDVFAATVAENVSLIKSIASRYHTEVEGLVMRSVAAGRDLSFLSRELRHRHGVTARRSKFIAKSQNNMATAAFTRVRQAEVGITEAVWLHSHGGNDPRPTHVANSGKRYNVSEGWFDPDPKVRKFIWPGQLPNCRCVSKPVVKGLS